ncbi:MAG: chromate resistance protein ChrB domain-containing protein [Thermoplasmata archaeon]
MRWVTERRPHVDRCASAWFVRRFVDRNPTFLFIDRDEPPPAKATPYDLPAARFGHKGRRVTFDAFLAAYHRRDKGLSRLADLVRDVDLGSFRIPESRGLDTLLYGLLLAEPDDREILRQTTPVFEGLYRYYLGEGRR